MAIGGLVAIAAAVVLLLGFAVGPKWFIGEKKSERTAESESAEGGSGSSKEADAEKGEGRKDDKVPEIVVPLPPGWQETSEFMGMDMAEMFGGGVEDEVAMDAFYVDTGFSNMIIAMHMDSGGAFPPLPSDITLEEMEEFIEENREDLLYELRSELLSGGLAADISEIRAFQTRSGDVGAEMVFDMQEGEKMLMGMGADLLLFFKGERMYMVMLMSLGGSLPGDTVKFLKENIHFK